MLNMDNNAKAVLNLDKSRMDLFLSLLTGKTMSLVAAESSFDRVNYNCGAKQGRPQRSLDQTNY